MTPLPDRNTTVSSQTSSRLLLLGWALIAIYAAWAFGLQRALASVLDPFTRNLLEQSLLTAFFLMHALGQWRGRELAAFAIVCFVISNLFENLSVMYGFPFGGFHHSEATGPRLFHIPWFVRRKNRLKSSILWSRYNPN